jgi:hypothetical protein
MQASWEENYFWPMWTVSINCVPRIDEANVHIFCRTETHNVSRVTHSFIPLGAVLYCIFFGRFGMGFHDPSLRKESWHHYQGTCNLLFIVSSLSKQTSFQLKQPPRFLTA